MFGIYLPVDGAYFIHFQGLLYSFKNLLDEPYKIHIIDLGLSPKNIQVLNSHFKFFNFEINKIPWTKESKINYKFKIDIIEKMLSSGYDYAMMFDAKNHLKFKLSEIRRLLQFSPVLINDVAGLYEKDWTHNTALKAMGVWDNESILNSFQYQSNNPVFNLHTAKEIIKEIVKYGNLPEALAPPKSKKSFSGDSRHRQDQSVISCILKKHNIKPCSQMYSSYHNTIHR